MSERTIIVCGAMTLCGVVLLAGWLMRRRAMRCCVRAGGEVYAVELFYVAVPLVMAAVLLGLVLMVREAVDLWPLVLLCGLAVALCGVGAMHALNRVELYADRCVSVAGLTRNELEYRELRGHAIVGERGTCKAVFSERYGLSLHFYSSIHCFRDVVAAIVARAQLVSHDGR